MALYLTEQDVAQLLTMPEAVEALEAAFARQGLGEVINQPRRRLHLPEGTYHTMIAGDIELQLFGIKAYASYRPQTRFLMLLYSAQNGDLLAMIEADKLGQIRTGAASGVATQHLARRSAGTGVTVGIFGTGWQARSQLEAVSVVRKIARVVAYGRDAQRRADFCAAMTQTLNVEVVAAEEPEQAAREQDIVITATTAREPVLLGQWLSPGTHVNVVGSNMLMKREVDEETVARSNVIVVDSIEQAKLEAGDLLIPFERRMFRWEQAVELADIVTGVSDRQDGDTQITLFKSLGLALEDVAVAAVVYRKALAQNRGTQIPMWQHE